MSQHDFVIDDADGAIVRADINAALQALASGSLGTSTPSTTYPGMLWADTTNSLLKMRNSADSAWITLGALDEAFLGLVPAGGSTGQILTKASGSDLDTAWASPAMGYTPPTPMTSTTALSSADHAKWFLVSIAAADITVTLPSLAGLTIG